MGKIGRYIDAGGSADLECVGDYFDRAVDRFGLARVVRACKLRAERPNRIALSAKVRADA